MLKIKTYSFFLFVLIFAACDKGYEVRVTNYYIEPMDSIVIGNNNLVFENTGLEVTTDFKHLDKGKYGIRFITKSKKNIYSSITIPGKGNGKRTIQIDAIEQVNIFEE